MSADRYRIARRISGHGTTELLLASQQGLAGLEKLVVIKRVLPQPFADQQFVQAFIGEARRASMLAHPNVAEIYDVHHDEQEAYVASEYISGEDLGFIIKMVGSDELNLSVGLACRIVAGSANNQLAEPEDAERLHERGILYLPDYVVNAGGALSFGLIAQGESPGDALMARMDRIGSMVDEILREAEERSDPPLAAARRRMQSALERARQGRSEEAQPVS